MNRLSFHLQLGLVSIAGSLTGLVLNGAWWWLVLVSIGALYVSIVSARTYRQAFWLGTLFGTTKLLVVLFWVFNTFPISWLGDFPAAAAISLIITYWLIAAVGIGMATGLAALFIKRLPSGWWVPAVAAIILTISESLGALLYSIVFSGPGSYLQAYFSFGYAGYALAMDNYFIALAQLGGVYGLSLFTYSLALYGTCAVWQRHRFAFVACVLLLLFPATINISSIPLGTSVTIVNTEFSAKFLKTEAGPKKKKEVLQQAVGEALIYQRGHIVLPEDSRFVAGYDSPQDAQQWLKSRTSDKEIVYLYDSARTTHNNKTVLRGYALQSNSDEVAYFDKSYLVPQGEFLPYFALGTIRLLPKGNWKNRVFSQLSYQSSELTTYPNNPNMAAFLFCFEAVNPVGVHRALARHQSTFIVHPVSHAWFNPSAATLRYQLIAMLRTQAVWQGVPIVVAGNGFTGFVAQPNGGIDSGTLLSSGKHWSLYEAEL